VPLSPLFDVIPSGLQPARDLLFDCVTQVSHFRAARKTLPPTKVGSARKKQRIGTTEA
jgi:hypothetical protein